MFIDEVVPEWPIKFMFSVPPTSVTKGTNCAVVNSPHCKCLIQVASNHMASGLKLMGSSFLRNAYVVYYLQKSEISITQVAYRNGSNIVAFLLVQFRVQPLVRVYLKGCSQILLVVVLVLLVVFLS